MRNADFERVGRYIYAFHRAAAPLDQLSGDDLATTLPSELAARAARLVRQFELRLKTFDAATDEELQASLEEAAAVRALIDEWRSTAK
ncbi:hypothetical protein FHW83_004380 [Duganella sp. SG902]|uniref:hypothetical protein n=1 Tax=Duganella sp. SG902 TaxID=2587016 RepID=UPI00159E2EF0|nr:hypothetical protein [Duganella sp. SG902]NVM78552.1 hypothetical protein [Duganella sp. SG902]